MYTYTIQPRYIETYAGILERFAYLLLCETLTYRLVTTLVQVVSYISMVNLETTFVVQKEPNSTSKYDVFLRIYLDARCISMWPIRNQDIYGFLRFMSDCHILGPRLSSLAGTLDQDVSSNLYQNKNLY